ncbi:MAG: diadenylate cyclase [Chitinophagales bacterium]|nr:diadenylate cyclase [Bacteroidota bacterium]MCB9044205.1 diadenylate cyclase [Chitinophagales bacterium]
MIAAIPFGFLEIRLLDVFDIVLAAILMYQVYRLLRGNLSFNILIGIILFFVLNFIVNALGMRLMSGILGKFIEVGVIALLIVFQPEVRSFLLVLGRRSGIGKQNSIWQFFFGHKKSVSQEYKWVAEEISRALIKLSENKLGALLVLLPTDEKPTILDSGKMLNADINGALIEAIFQKKSPLHDGAMLLSSEKIIAAACVLPVTEQTNLPENFGMRHKAAIGITERLEVSVLVVSEETGTISFAQHGKIVSGLNEERIQQVVRQAFIGQNIKKPE